MIPDLRNRDDLERAFPVVCGADDEVDALNRDIYGLVEECVRKDPDRASTYIHLLGISRHVERIGDHASNIAEDVVYLTEGRIVRHRTEQFMPSKE